jgi:hypothetical protein
VPRWPSADRLAGAAEDVLDDAAEGETTTTMRAAMPAMSEPYSTADAALVHLGQAGVEQDAEVVEHGVGSLECRGGDEFSVVARWFPGRDAIARGDVVLTD